MKNFSDNKKYMEDVVNIQSDILNMSIDEFLGMFYQSYKIDRDVNLDINNLTDYGITNMRDLVKIDEGEVISVFGRYWAELQHFLYECNLDVDMTDIQIDEIHKGNMDVSSLFIPIEQVNLDIDMDTLNLLKTEFYNLNQVLQKGNEFSKIQGYEDNYGFVFDLNELTYALDKKGLKLEMSKDEIDEWSSESIKGKTLVK